MAVRVEVTLTVRRKRLDAVAILNSGFESSDAEVIIPVKLAEELGLLPRPPKNARIDTYASPGGATRMVFIPRGARVELKVNRKTRPAQCSVAISEVEHEVILNDHAVDALAVEIVAPGRGLWRLRGEKKNRRSAAPRYW